MTTNNETTKIIINHIPRTIFGVKFDFHNAMGDEIQYNCLRTKNTKKEQEEEIKRLHQYPQLYKNIVELKWIIKP